MKVLDSGDNRKPARRIHCAGGSSARVMLLCSTCHNIQVVEKSQLSILTGDSESFYLRRAVLLNESCYCEQDSLTIWTSLTFSSPVSELSFVTPALCAMLFVSSFIL